jgi:hypothetical protein
MRLARRLRSSTVIRPSHPRLPLMGLPFFVAWDQMVSDVIAHSGPVLNSTLKCATAWRRWVTRSRTVLGSSPAVVGN